MSNTLTISSNRSAVLSLTTLQHDNLTPLKVVLWEGVADSFGAGATVLVKYERPDGVKLTSDEMPLAEEIDLTILNTVLAKRGLLWFQVRILDDTGYEWHAERVYKDIPGSIDMGEPASPEPLVWVRVPVAFVQGNLFSYNPASGRLIDLEVTPQAIIQAYQDFLAMLGNSVATLTDGKLTASQIPALSINDTFPVASEAELLELTAQRGDVGLIVAEEVVTDSYLLTADDPTVADNWVKLGVSYVANAGHANTADSATESEKINGKRLIAMSQAEYDIAVLDPDTYYIVTP